MEYRKLNPETDSVQVVLTLPVHELKILYNACVDITNEFPQMDGYARVAEKLQYIIDCREAI